MRLVNYTGRLSLAALLLVGGAAFAQEDDKKMDNLMKIRERMSKDDGAPKVGDVAPTFNLKSLDGKSETDLASFKDKKPVVLFFGSYT
jgi:hypothetical protein